MSLRLKATLLLPLLFVSATSFAETATAGAAPVVSPIDMSNFSFRLNVTERFALTDSTRTTSLDAFSQTGRFGLNYAYKNVTATFEAQAGSTSNGVSTSTVSSNGATANSPMSDSQAGQSYFAVRRANLGLFLKKSDSMSFSVILGRDRLTGSTYYAGDAFSSNAATNIANQSSYAAEDGIGLRYQSKQSFGTIFANAGWYSSLGFTVLRAGTAPMSVSSISQADTKFSSPTLTDSRAYALMVGANINAGSDAKVEARAYYGNQPLAPVAVVSITPTATATSSAATNAYAARDLQSIEASVGLDYKKGFAKGGVWYQNQTLGRTQASTQWAGNSIHYVNGSFDDSQNISTVGAGVVVNSKIIGIQDLLWEGDNLRAVAAYQNISGQMFVNNSSSGSLCSIVSTSSASNCNKPTIDQINLAVGYQQAVYTVDLNWFWTKANSNIYAGNSANWNGTTRIQQDNANILYLAGTVSL